MNEEIIRLRAERRAERLMQIRSRNSSSGRERSVIMNGSIETKANKEFAKSGKDGSRGLPGNKHQPSIRSTKRQPHPLGKNRSTPKKSRDSRIEQFPTRGHVTTILPKKSSIVDEIPFDERSRTSRIFSSEKKQHINRRKDLKYRKIVSVHSDDMFREDVVSRMMKGVDPSVDFRPFAVASNPVTVTPTEPVEKGSHQVSDLFRIPTKLRQSFSFSGIDSEENSLTITESLSEPSEPSEPAMPFSFVEDADFDQSRLRYYPSFVRALSVEVSEIGNDFDTFLHEDFPDAVEDMKYDFMSTYCCCR